MATEKQLDTAGITIPDQYKFDASGHWVDVFNSIYDRERSE